VNPSIFLAAVAQKTGGLVTLDHCEFEHKLPPPNPELLDRKGVKVASVLLDNTAEEDRKNLIRLDARETCFISGQAAVVVKGAAEVRQTQCAFGPHATHFAVRGAAEPDATILRLDHCSLFVDRGPFLRLDGGDTNCRLKADYCLFAWSEDNAATDAPFVLQTDNSRPAVKYQGGHNCFYRPVTLWLRRGKDQPQPAAINGTEWTRFLVEAGGSDPTSVFLDRDRNPWEAARPLEERDLKKQFRVNLKLPQLRPGGKLVGVQVCSWGHSYTDEELVPLKLPSDVAVKSRQKIVEPNARELKQGVYRTLKEAVTAAEKGDVVLIKYTGLLPVKPIRADEPDFQVTLKAYPGFHPTLTLDGKTLETDAALFRLHNGQLKFEGLEFLLRPDNDKFVAQTVVTVEGNGQVKFEQCVFTLEDKALRPNVVTVAEATKGMMTMPGSRTVPEVHFTNCFLRGQGDGIKVPVSRPFELNVDNSLIVLAGSFLVVSGNGKEASVMDTSQVKLKHVTTYLTEQLIRLSAGKSVKGLVATRVNPVSECLFVAANGQSLIDLEGVENEGQMKTLVLWEGKGNAYSGFDKMLTQRPVDFGMLKQLKQEDWQTFTGNDNETFPKIEFKVPPPSEKPFSQAMPKDFQVKMEADAGAALDQVATPYVPEEIVPETPDDEVEPHPIAR
jgi:hypothetical protein